MKKHIKKFLLSLGVLSLLIMSLGVSAFAATETPATAVASSEIFTHQGETFTTTVYIPDNADIVDFDITLKYDTELLNLVDIQENDDIKGTIIFNAENDGEIVINYTRTNKNVTSYLPLLDLTFSVDENIGVGTYDCVAVDRTATYIAHKLNNAGTLEPVSFECAFAPLTIYEVGDVDLSRSVDIGDATYIRRHLAGFEGAILSEYKLSLADTFCDGVVDIADAVCLQRHLAHLDVLYGNRINITFYTKDGEKYATKSVVYDGTLHTIPKIPNEEGYSGGVWSLSSNEYIEPEYDHLQKDISVYAYYSDHDDPAMDYYKKLLTNMYYSGDMPTNLSSDQNLQSKIFYQEGRYASIVWNSDSNYILNSTTGAFTKPTYPQDLTLTATIISYDENNKIDSEDTISFEYKVPGVYLTPTKASVEDFLKFYFTDSTDDQYRVNYDVKLISKINSTVIPADGALYDDFEIRLTWYQNVDGVLQPVSQIKRTTASQVNDYVAVATFNGKPLEDDGKIYIDNVEVTAIDKLEIKNYIISQISTTGTLATDGKVLWNNDIVYGSNVTWETGAADIAYVANNVIKLKDDAITGSILPLNARVSYPVDGGTEEFVLSYNLSVSCDNTVIKAPENMDLELYKAIKEELEETQGYRGDLTSAALSNVKFVNLDLSKYPEISSLRGLSYCKNLRTLNISGLHITDGTMNQIATLSYLEAFIARGCGLDNLSDGGQATLRNAVNLKLIDLTDNNFTTLDSVFAEGIRYGKLREVYLSKNKLMDINALSRAPMMTYLSLSENGLTTEGSASIENYPYLLYLSLANNDIDSVEHLKNLKSIKELRLQNNNISDVKELRRLVNLEILYLGHNKIKTIDTLNALTNLKILYVNDNQLFDISALKDLSQLECINVSNNGLSSLSVLINYKLTMTEIYAENNKITDFSFINGADKLHILMLSGNKTEIVQENMSAWLSNLSDIEILTLSNIRLNDLTFLNSMSKLVRLDIADCGLHAFTGETSNIRAISDRYETLKILDISNNDFSDSEDEIQNLRNITLLTILYADNISDSLDAYSLTYSMTELRYISLENCGISKLNWLYKFNKLAYVDLAGNHISDVNLNTHISNASIKTINELYLDTDVPCRFENAYRITDFNVERFSLEGINIANIEKLPDLENIQYLNLDGTGLCNLTGDDPELADLYSIERYTTLETLDVSNLETDISVLEDLASVTTVYAVGTTDSRSFYESNLHTLQRLYKNGVTCYLYDKQTPYEPVAETEGANILSLLPDISCNVVVAAEDQFSNNNPYLEDIINDFEITWSVSNSDNYEIVDNRLHVKDYTGIENEALTLTASIKVYPDQKEVCRSFTVNTEILRASSEYLNVDATGYSEQLTRDSAFNYRVSLINAATEGFDLPVKPVEDAIVYSYEATSESGLTIPYKNILNVGNDCNFEILLAAPLNSKVVIHINIGHNTNAGELIFDMDEMAVSVTVASRTFKVTFVTNGGVLTDNNGVVRDSCEYIEDAPIFDGLALDKPGYKFEGWYLDSACTELFGVDGTEATMPSENITLYAKWKALSYNIYFDAVGGIVDKASIEALSDVVIGELPIPTRQYYIFDGWFTSADGGIAVNPTDSFARTEDMTLYAHWTLNSYIISFDANNGETDTSELRAYCGEQVGELPVPTRDYYTFEGWFTDAVGGTEITAETCLSSAEDITVYAHWTENPISDWVRESDLPEDVQIVATKTQYRYRDRTKETKTSSSSSLSGWIKESGPIYGSWSAWSAWNPGSASGSDTVGVETATVYGYYYFVCSSCGAHIHSYGGQCYTWMGGCGRYTVPESSFTSVWLTTPWTSAVDTYGTGKKVLNTSTDGRVFTWNESGSARAGYRTRTRSVTYTYYKWSDYGAWSNWSDTTYVSSESRQTETRKMVQYREK